MIEAFVGLHKPKEEMSMEGYTDPQRTLSQVQYLPETLRRCVANSVDRTAEALLGKPIANRPFYKGSHNGPMAQFAAQIDLRRTTPI